MLSNNLFLLFIEFFKVGLFTFGGGYASLPFLYQMVDIYNWFTSNQLTQMIAIAGITPGPVGLNMATFAGFKALGVFGSLVSSFALILPMIIITSLVFKFYLRFSQNECVKSILYVLRPTSTALICAVGVKLFYDLIIKNTDYIGFGLVLFLFLLTFKLKRDPIIYILIAAIVGILLTYVKQFLNI